jgi:hypothetical protein
MSVGAAGRMSTEFETYSMGGFTDVVTIHTMGISMTAVTT